MTFHMDHYWIKPTWRVKNENDAYRSVHSSLLASIMLSLSFVSNYTDHERCLSAYNGLNTCTTTYECIFYEHLPVKRMKIEAKYTVKSVILEICFLTFSANIYVVVTPKWFQLRGNFENVNHMFYLMELAKHNLTLLSTNGWSVIVACPARTPLFYWPTPYSWCGLRFLVLRYVGRTKNKGTLALWGIFYFTHKRYGTQVNRNHLQYPQHVSSRCMSH